MVEAVISFFSGAAFWGVVREIIAHQFKEAVRVKQARRKLISDETDLLVKELDAIFLLALKYYGEAGNAQIDVSREIMRNVSRAAMIFNSINVGLKGEQYEPMMDFFLVNFRRAVTWDLDSARRPAWDLNSPGLHRIADCSASFREKLAQVRSMLV